MSDTAKPLSRNETLKERSNFLRGTIAEGLADISTGAVSEDDTQLTKFHGIYQQDDRDLRAERAKKRMEKAFIFMARLRVPGGRMTPAQWLRMEQVAAERGNGTLRLTTRQTIQFHGIIKTNLKPAIQAINDALMDTIAACGDVNRNVIASVNPYESRAHATVLDLAQRLSAHLRPRTRAYHEIWLDGEKISGGEVEDEPIYGRAYMPRKFKIALTVPPHNDVDVLAHDLGFVAIVEDGTVVGFDVTVGGGMGMTHGETDTFPRIGDVIGFCRPDEVIEVAEAVVTVQRDFGDRADRKHARLKYTIERRGLDWFLTELHTRLGRPLAPARGFAFAGNGDRLGWTQGEDGDWHHTVLVENGRVHGPILAGLHAIAEAHEGAFFITCNQNLVIARVKPEAKPRIDALLREHGLAHGASGLRRNAMACVALPTCGLALAESERYMPTLLTALESVLDRFGLREDEITIRMSGCPNGCSRPYLAEIAFAGRGPGTYNLYLGAAFDGTRMNKLYRRDLDHGGIVAALTPLLEDYARARLPGERFGDFVIRRGHIAATVGSDGFHKDLAPQLAAE